MATITNEHHVFNMRKLILSILVFYITIFSHCQEKIIAEQVLNSIGNPIIGVSDSQKNSNNCSVFDYIGAFHLLINSDEIINYSINSLEISDMVTTYNPLRVSLIENTVDLNTYPNRFGFVSQIKVDYLPTSFIDFQNVLNDYNIVAMNRTDVTMNFEMGGTYGNYYLGLNFGYVLGGDDNHDSLDIEFNYTQYGVNIGYNLVDSKRFLLQPKLTLAWNRYRLINNDKKRKIPLENYVADRDLDMRFNQLTGLVGLNLAYKMYDNNLLFSDYWTIGLYGGYLYKLNDKAWIYSKRNRLESDNKIRIENYSIGLFISFNIE
jgi:hypothetical protein